MVDHVALGSVLIPLMFPLALLWLIPVLAIGILAIVSIAYLCLGEWHQAAIHFAVWHCFYLPIAASGLGAGLSGRRPCCDRSVARQPPKI